MKIGIFDPYLDALEGGEKYMLTAASCLSDRNEVSVFWDDKTILEKGEKKYELNLKKVTIVPNIFSSQVSLLTRLQLSKEYDVIFFLSDGSIPVISSKLYVHFQFPAEWVRSTMKSRFKMARVNGVICNSQFTKKYIDKTFSVKSYVISPPVVESLKRSIDLKKKEKIILSVGRYSKMLNGEQYKKQNRMIDAFKKMVDKGLKEWELVLVVSYQDKDKGNEDLEASALGYPIHIKRNIKRQELNTYYERSMIYWHATGMGEDIITHPELAEHFGISTVEAMSFGLVPVVIDAGGQSEIVRDEENGLVWNTEEELIQKTKELMHNEKKRLQLAAAATKRSEDFSIEKFCETLHNIIT